MSNPTFRVGEDGKLVLPTKISDDREQLEELATNFDKLSEPDRMRVLPKLLEFDIVQVEVELKMEMVPPDNNAESS